MTSAKQLYRAVTKSVFLGNEDAAYRWLIKAIRNQRLADDHEAREEITRWREANGPGR